MTVDKL
jgi:hypothetical protein